MQLIFTEDLDLSEEKEEIVVVVVVIEEDKDEERRIELADHSINLLLFLFFFKKRPFPLSLENSANKTTPQIFLSFFFP